MILDSFHPGMAHVLDAEPGVGPWKGTLRSLEGRQNHILRPVAQSVNHNLPACLMRVHDRAVPDGTQIQRSHNTVRANFGGSATKVVGVV